MLLMEAGISKTCGELVGMKRALMLLIVAQMWPLGSHASVGSPQGCVMTSPATPSVVPHVGASSCHFKMKDVAGELFVVANTWSVRINGRLTYSDGKNGKVFASDFHSIPVGSTVDATIETGFMSVGNGLGV
ncbi:MAG: hypothetical protein NVSMB57_15080 [Actinomycetota bacterium]